jgi:beta-lactamase superfamily II metal-dependent hydrolase
MLEDYAEMEDDPDFEPYDEAILLDEKSARSVIDLDDDPSCSNRSSMVLLFAPSDGRHFLFPGDAACISLSPVLREYGSILKGCTLKVPHHGSKHNLSTSIIDCLMPASAVISAQGSKKHPNSGIVYWLSRYCNVYSTHKSNALIYGSDINGKAIPLKERIREAP